MPNLAQSTPTPETRELFCISEHASPHLSRAAEIKMFKDWLLEEVTVD